MARTRAGTNMVRDDIGDDSVARPEITNRLFFRLYQCANLMHKTGTKALETSGVTTQQWAVLGALSRAEAEDGMGVNDLADYLKVSRQNLSGVVDRLKKAGLLDIRKDTNDRRSRRILLTGEGRRVWRTKVTPLIANYYEEALAGISTDDLIHMCHYLNRVMENFLELEQT